MKLLFITHKVHELDDEYAFTSQWAEEFQRQGFSVTIMCLEKGGYQGPCEVISLGKEKGNNHFVSVLTCIKYIITHKHDRVFVHMNPKWTVVGSWYWWATKTPVYLWYTHYTMHLPLRISHWLCKRLFCATKESMPQYENDPKKVVTGHGVDTTFWNMELPARDQRKAKTQLLSVHRISRSKHIDLTIRALALLPDEYTLTQYGPVYENDYHEELNALIKELKLEKRVFLNGPVPMPELKKIYPQYNVMVNMAGATIDKTMVEGMCAGAHPVVSRDNAIAIGLTSAPVSDTPEALAEYIKNLEPEPIENIVAIAKNKHSLQTLIENMSAYIKKGE